MISGIAFERYRVPLASGVANANRSWAERAGLIVTLTDDHGRTGQGEAAPLPGYSDDTLDGTERALRAISAQLLQIPSDIADLEALLDAHLPNAGAAARCALEVALLDLLGKRRGLPVHRLLADDATGRGERVPLAALVHGETAAEAVDQALAAVSRGFSTLKFKVARPGAFDAELELLREVRRRVGPGVRLRLDANRAFPRDELAGRLAALAGSEPEFLEEPSDSLPDSSPIPLALDESLRELGALDPQLPARGVVAVVLKPGVLGGLLRAREIARNAASLGLVPVVSHAFEGPLGHAAACELALALGPSRYAAGLAPHAALAAWGVALPRACSGAELRFHDAPGLGLDTLRVRA